MRILYLVPDLIGLPGGIARYCRHVCSALTEIGEDVSVISLRDALSSDPEVAKLSLASYEACNKNKKLFLLRAVSELLRHRPQLIISGHPNFAPLAYLLSKISGTPFVVFLYGTDSWATLTGTRGFAFRRADLYVAISGHTANMAARANRLTKEKIAVLHNCLDPAFVFSQGGQRELSLLTVSRITTFEPLKGHELVMQVMPQLLKVHPDLIYNVVGDGDRRPALEKLARDLGITQSVRFHGIVSDETLSELYKSNAVFVMPSTVEGFGFVFAEAMAHGMPAIGGNTDAASEVILDGVTGYVVDPTSADALAQSVGQLLSDHSLRRDMGQAAIEHVRGRFAYPEFKDRLKIILRGGANQWSKHTR